MRGRTLRAVLVAVGVLALPASAAASSHFITTKRGVEEPLAVRGASGSFGDQELYLPPFRIFCAAARVKGGPSPGYTELRNFVRFSRCATAVRVGEQSLTVPVKVKSVLDLFFKGEGNAEIQNPVDVSIPALKCTITSTEGDQLRNAYSSGGAGMGAGKAELPYAQLLVPVLNLRDFPTGYQKRLQIEVAQIGLQYGFEGGCANLTPEEGAWSGHIVEEAVGGELEFEPGSEWNRVENKE